MFWRRKQQPYQRPLPPARVTLAAIGFVQNEVKRPQLRGWERVISRIELLPEHAPRLQGLGGYSHLLITFYMDLAESAKQTPESYSQRSVAKKALTHACNLVSAWL